MNTCKGCGREYDKDDCSDLPGPRYGWHESYGDCFFCFCYAMFGGLLEPEPDVVDWPPYEIKPPAHRHW